MRYNGQHIAFAVFSMLLMVILALAGCGGGITALEETSGYDRLILDGWREYNLTHFETAQSIFYQAQGLDPNRAEGYIGTGWSLFMRQKPDSALVEFYHGFDFTTTVNDTLDTVCGISGCYLARGENSKAVSYLDGYNLSYFEDVFPLQDHDFFLDRGDLELVYAQAYYRLKLYSNTEKADPNNAVYHLNKVLSTPYTYTTPEELMNQMIEYLTQSQGILYR
jgi:hypothetical protein